MDTINLTEIAYHVMLARGFIPEFPQPVLEQIAAINSPADPSSYTDLRHELFVSIDNDDSKDLDQLTFALPLESGNYLIYVAVADVDALVKKGSPIDLQAAHNTTSVYTPTKVFSMLPLKLSTDLTSLNEQTDRCALVVEMEVDQEGKYELKTLYQGWVRNRAKLTYNGVAAWLENKKPIPSVDPEVLKQLTLQDTIAQKIQGYRDRQGALHFATLEVEPVLDGERPIKLEEKIQNRAHLLIENFMIAANVGATRYLMEHNVPTLRRIVETPKRWDRIVSLAQEYKITLPAKPDAKALREFLIQRQKADPLRFADLSLAVIKLIGRGEYKLGVPGQASEGHFDLALQDYAHTTAPNRRYPDLIMQRLLKSQLHRQQTPYSQGELRSLAEHCTEREDAATKVERHLRKSAAAIVLAPQIGHTFEGIVTGASEKGTWVRLFNPPIEGKLVQGFQGVDVGDRIKVKLVDVDPPRGYIDFSRVS